MGANAQTTVPDFVAETVLTAAKLDISAATGVPVFATTVTRDAAFGGANKVLAEGQTCYLESTNVVQYYDGAAWATVGPAAASGLVLIKAQTIGNAVSSVTVSDCFSATYDNYKVMISGGVTAANARLDIVIGSVSSYYYGSFGVTMPFSAFKDGATAQPAIPFAGGGTVNGLDANFEVLAPFLSKRTTVNLTGTDMLSTMFATVATINTTGSYTAFTLGSNQTMTGGVIRVYGYANS